MSDNKSLKVLVIAYYFPPMGLSGVQRTLKFTKYMSSYNWKPTVITTGKTAYYAHDKQLLEEAEKSDIEIIRTEGKDINSIIHKLGTVKMPAEWIRKILSLISKTFFIPDNKIWWANKAYKISASLIKKNKYDLIFVSIPPFSSFIIAAKLKQKYNIPLVVDYRDLWFGNHFAFYPTPYHKYKHKKLEEAALRIADKIVAVNRVIKAKILTTYKFLDYDNIVIIPHGYDEMDFAKLRKYKVNNRKMRITYAGIFYENITPKFLFKAFSDLIQEKPKIAKNIEFVFVGHFRKENVKLVKKYNLTEYITEMGYLNHTDSVKQLMLSDILWVMLGKSPNIDTVSSGKLFEYFGSRKVVLATLPEGASQTAAQEYGASFITGYNDIEGIKNQLIAMHKLYKQNKLPQPNEEFCKKHERKYLTEQLIKQFQFIIKEDL
ncbi:glycosyltransferase [Bacteroidota bacterium]